MLKPNEILFNDQNTLVVLTNKQSMQKKVYIK